MKKIVSVLLLFVMAFCLTACAGRKEDIKQNISDSDKLYSYLTSEEFRQEAVALMDSVQSREGFDDYYHNVRSPRLCFMDGRKIIWINITNVYFDLDIFYGQGYDGDIQQMKNDWWSSLDDAVQVGNEDIPLTCITIAHDTEDGRKDAEKEELVTHGILELISQFDKDTDYQTFCKDDKARRFILSDEFRQKAEKAMKDKIEYSKQASWYGLTDEDMYYLCSNFYYNSGIMEYEYSTFEYVLCRSETYPDPWSEEAQSFTSVKPMAMIEIPDYAGSVTFRIYHNETDMPSDGGIKISENIWLEYPNDIMYTDIQVGVDIAGRMAQLIFENI